MSINYFSVLLAAALLVSSPAVAKDKKEKKEKAKTEQKVGKKAKKTSFSLFKKKKKEVPQRKDSVRVERPQVDRKGLFHVT